MHLFKYCRNILVFVTCYLFVPCHAMLEGLYCGEDNCYDLLGVTRDASKGEISKSYRHLAKQWHPDRHKKDKDKASAMFQKIATAYETLRDEDSRKDYDYMLDNPDEFYSHYYRYYRRRVAPKVDVRVVIAVTITIISIVQYLSAWNNYRLAIDYLVTVPKYRIQAIELAKQDGSLVDSKKKKDRTKTKEEIKLEEENALKSIIRDRLDIRGGYRKPDIRDILWLQLLFSPYYIVLYICWNINWFWKYTICRRDYSEEDKKHVIRKYMKLSQTRWEALEDKDVEEFMERELWIKENFTTWKKEKDEEMKEQLADNSRYKQYRRYIKKGGPGQMSFGPE